MSKFFFYTTVIFALLFVGCQNPILNENNHSIEKYLVSVNMEKATKYQPDYDYLVFVFDNNSIVNDPNHYTLDFSFSDIDSIYEQYFSETTGISDGNNYKVYVHVNYKLSGPKIVHMKVYYSDDGINFPKIEEVNRVVNF